MEEVLIRAKHLIYRYPDTDRNALDDISFEIKRGEVIGIIGANGAGKTMLCSAVKGIVPHSFGGSWGGSLEVCGIEVSESSIGALSTLVSMTFQNPETQIVGTTVEEDIAFTPENLGRSPEMIRKEVEEVMETVRLPLSYKKHPPYAMSGGEKQRLAIASSIISEPEILIFDEPTTELDPVGKYEVLQIIKKLANDGNNTVIVVEQDMDYLIGTADRLFVMNEGKLILQGKTRDVMSQIDLLKEAKVNLPDIIRLWELCNRKTEVFLSIREAEAYFKPCGIKFPKREEKKEREDTKEPAVTFEHVSFSYGDRDILKDVSLSIQSGEFAAVLGKNGAGKTTLVKHLNGLLKPVSGVVRLFGEPTRDKTVAELAKTVAYVFQNPDHQLFEQTVEEEIAFGPRNLGWKEEKIRAAVENALSISGLSEFRKENPLSLERGLKQLLILASVVAMDVDIFVVDEPTTGLGRDYKDRIGILLKHLNEQGKTILLVTHDMEFTAAYANRTIVVHDGKPVLDGNIRTVFSEREKLREAYVFPPQISELALALGAEKDALPLTVEEFLEGLK